MAPHLIAEPAVFRRPLPQEGLHDGYTTRSPAVSVAVALGVVGCLLAGSGQDPLPQTTLTMLFFLLVSEVEVRRIQVPLWLAVITLAGCLCGIALTEAAPQSANAAMGAGLVLVLASPLLATGIVRIGTFIVAAVPGALWGASVTADVLVTALLIGTPVVTIHILRRGTSTPSFPFIVLLGLAGALVQVL
jgi:hypothetical protein